MRAGKFPKKSKLTDVSADWEKRIKFASDTDFTRSRGGVFGFGRSPLTRRIVTLNLLALSLLILGVLNQNAARENLISQRSQSLLSEAQLVAFAMRGAYQNNPQSMIDKVSIRSNHDVMVLSDKLDVIAIRRQSHLVPEPEITLREMPITAVLEKTWGTVRKLFETETVTDLSKQDNLDRIKSLAAVYRSRGEPYLDLYFPRSGISEFSAIAPIFPENRQSAVVVLQSPTGEIDRFVRAERERVLQLLVMGIVISVVLSLILASNIANPLNQLATAAELGRDRNKNRSAPGRVSIPDLSGRPDEIGRLSAALRGMVAALYDRIESNEQFAADVAHKIKNPLASLRSAVGTLHRAQKEDQRIRLLEVIDHDVRRLDRLVSDISNASRLDSELVKDDQEHFDLVPMVKGLSDYLGSQAQAKGIDFILDLPEQKIMINGLEGRLAQVFVNLIGNAISFCTSGDAIRVWMRMRDHRVLVVVEDTGPGIPEEALEKVFKRFYSERPASDFGNNSGLGLAISKQIVEAHNGVIWAENIRPLKSDARTAPLGARFVVGLPI